MNTEHKINHRKTTTGFSNQIDPRLGPLIIKQNPLCSCLSEKDKGRKIGAYTPAGADNDASRNNTRSVSGAE